MTAEEPKIKIKFLYPDKPTSEYQVTYSEAMELEILAITKPPKRLMKTIFRVGKELLERAVEEEVGLDLILGTSRSGDIYNALKYLEFREILERRKDIKLIRILSTQKLKDLLNTIEFLLQV